MARDSFEILPDSTVIRCLSTKHVLQIPKTLCIGKENVYTFPSLSIKINRWPKILVA